MNSDVIKGEGRDLGGRVKETAGSLTGDRSLQGKGLLDQFGGMIQKTFGRASGGSAGGGLADQVRQFAKARPFATSALVGVVGMALLNTLRGK